MSKPLLFRGWMATLIQGLLMIILSIIIFNNPGTVLVTLAFWLGLTTIIGGVAGIVYWFNSTGEERDSSVLFGSLIMLVAGFLMVFKLAVTVWAITVVFGLLTLLLGLSLISSSWKNKTNWTLWWLVGILGVLTLITGIKALFDVYSGAESISTIIGIAVLLAGIGLLLLAYLKHKLASKLKDKIESFKE